MHTLDHYKTIVERDFKNQGMPLPDGFAITYNEETQLVKVFLDGDSYKSMAKPLDVIVSRWSNGKWEDR